MASKVHETTVLGDCLSGLINLLSTHMCIFGMAILRSPQILLALTALLLQQQFLALQIKHINEVNFKFAPTLALNKCS